MKAHHFLQTKIALFLSLVLFVQKSLLTATKRKKNCPNVVFGNEYIRIMQKEEICFCCCFFICFEPHLLHWLTQRDIYLEPLKRYKLNNENSLLLHSLLVLLVAFVFICKGIVKMFSFGFVFQLFYLTINIRMKRNFLFKAV